MKNKRISEKLSHLVCLHTSEWSYKESKLSSLKSKLNTLFDEGIKEEEDAACKQELIDRKKAVLDAMEKRVKNLSWWREVTDNTLFGNNPFAPGAAKPKKKEAASPTEIPFAPEEELKGPTLFPVSKPKVYHFHPLAFVRQMRMTKTTECFCYNQGLVKIPCYGKGTEIKEEHYDGLSISLDVEKEVFKAVAKVESGDRSSFINIEPKHTWILYERHKAFNFVKEEHGIEKANEIKTKHASLFNSKRGGYHGGAKEIIRLNDAKAIIGNEIPIMSCSWGKFQIMGEYFNHLYKTPMELEQAQNLCELQQFMYFQTFLNKVKGKAIINAMRKKEWDKIALFYNGSAYKENQYDIKMKNAYEQYKK